MACYFPKYTKNPYFGKTKSQFRMMAVPCGICKECLMSRTNQWVFRLEQELKVSESAYFTTLTYAPENLQERYPVYKKNGTFLTTGGQILENSQLTLNKYDYQCYIKRLRRLQSGSSKSDIKYLCAGEYGEDYQRPHFHDIIFNVDPNLIESTWGFGNVLVKPVNSDYMRYVVKYCCKTSPIGKADWDQRLPQFNLFSQGLGFNYITPQIIRYHRNDYLKRTYVMLENGTKVPMPKIFKDKIFTKLQRYKQSEVSNAAFAENFQRKLDVYLRNHDDAKDYWKNDWESRLHSQQAFLNRQRMRNKGF